MIAPECLVARSPTWRTGNHSTVGLRNGLSLVKWVTGLASFLRDG